jgi:para-aminobenzoate synthetase/4-amino-4-deoxychorismate lyase
MTRSASWLGLPFSQTTALERLHAAVDASTEPLRVRLLLSEDGQLSCTAGALGLQPPCWTFAISPRRVDSRNPLLRHKTSWREFYDDERDHLAQTLGVDEAIFLNERDELTESSRANIFVRCGGRLLTPPLASGLLDGVLRRALLEAGRCREAVLTQADLDAAEEIFLGNSLRGLIPAMQKVVC